MTPDSSCRSPVHTADDKPNRLVILYGSQTGVAKSIATRLTLQGRFLFGSHPTHHTPSVPPVLPICLRSLNEYSPITRLVKEQLILLICSTTGYGVPPDNMLGFWKRIMHRSLPPGQSLPCTLHFVVLGIGDSSYPNFNVVARKLYRRFVQLGASPLNLPSSSPGDFTDPGLGLADEQSELGLNGLLSWWVPTFWMTVAEHFKLSFCPSPMEMPLKHTYLESPSVVSSFWPMYSITTGGSSSDQSVQNCEHGLGSVHSEQFSYPAAIPSTFQLFRVVNNVRVTSADHFQDTRLLSIQMKNQTSMVHFKPGDVIFVQAPNIEHNVSLLFQATQVVPSEQIYLSQLDSNFPLSCEWFPDGSKNLCASWLATYYFDLNAIPDSFFFTNLAALAHLAMQSPTCEDLDISRLKLEHERLQELGSCLSPDAVDDFYDYVTRPRRTVVEVLTDFPTTASLLSLKRWFDVLPGPIRARPYSIASAPPNLELLVAVVHYQTRLSRPRQGLASTFLASLKLGNLFSGWIASDITGAFDYMPLLKSPAPPCLLIATGTCIAPFRSFLWHQNSTSPGSNTNNVLVFGCRYKNKDFYFADEWTQLERLGRLKSIFAFSREPSGSEAPTTGRVYVQHKLQHHSDMVWSVLRNPDSFVFICGGAKSVPKEIRDSLLVVCQTAGKLSGPDAESFITALESSGRMQVECWN